MEQDHDHDVCPFLGLADDRGSYLTYPSYENSCYAPPVAETISLNEQTFFCLGGNRERCPRYQERHARLQSTPQALEPEDAAAVMAAALAGGDDDSVRTDDFTWQEQAPDGDWDDLEPETTPPPPPLPPLAWPAAASSGGRNRRPVWPLLLSAGTLVGVLMVCAFLSMTWLGLRTLSSEIALNPTDTPVPGANITPPPGVAVITSTLIPNGGVVVVVATPTPDPAQVTSTVQAGETATAGALFPTETPTDEFFFPTATPDFATATPTWTFEAFVTPTPRDTPTFFPTNTPDFSATNTPTWTPAPIVTVTNTPSAYSASFTASPTAIQYGQTTTLSWTVTGVKAIYLDGNGVSGPSGTQTERPTQTTTYVLRIVKSDNSVTELTQTVTVAEPTPSSTPTATPTPTSTPFVNITFAEDLSITSIDGSESGCRTGQGCTLFQIQVRNVGNRPVDYVMSRTENIPIGWGVFFCWSSDCEFGSVAPPKTLAVGARDTVSINFRVPAYLVDGQEATINVQGNCPACQNPPFNQYNHEFRVVVTLPTATPFPTATATPTQLATATPTATPSPTPTATSPSQAQ